MRLVVVRTHRMLAPFDEPVSQAAVGMGTLWQHQQALAALAGLEAVQVDNLEQAASDRPTLLLKDHTFLSRRLVRAWMDMARRGAGQMRVALPASRFTELYGQHQGLTTTADGAFIYDAWWLPGGVPPQATWSALDEVRAATVPFRERVLSMPVPPNIIGRPDHQHPLTTTVAMHVLHWVHVLWLGNLWPQIELVERITSRPLGTLGRVLRALRPSVSATKWALARSFSYLGRHVSIHPTACVEGSVLGDGVTVGPFALVRGSVLGRGTVVEERANVGFSTLGERCFISKNSTVFACVGYPNADLCINGMQFCVAGRNAGLTSLVRPMDMKYRDDVSIFLDGASVKVKGLMVGSCFGHGSFVGPEVLIAPGREIPNGTVVAPSPGAVMTRVADEVKVGGRVAHVDKGVLVDLGKAPDR